MDKIFFESLHQMLTTQIQAEQKTYNDKVACMLLGVDLTVKTILDVLQKTEETKSEAAGTEAPANG